MNSKLCKKCCMFLVAPSQERSNLSTHCVVRPTGWLVVLTVTKFSNFQTFVGFQKIPKPYVFKDILSNFGFGPNPPPHPSAPFPSHIHTHVIIADLALYNFGLSLQLPLEIVLCRFGLIYFQTPFNSSSGIYLHHHIVSSHYLLYVDQFISFSTYLKQSYG